MAKNTHSILDSIKEAGAGPDAGMSVPEGYFDGFCARMEDMLPERPELEQPQGEVIPATMWTRIRPYVYMAAMFAGVWLMLQMFTSLFGVSDLTPIDQNPVIAEALSSDEFLMDYVYDDLTSWDIVDQMIEDGTIESADDLDALYAPDEGIVTADGNQSTDYILPQ